MNFARINMIAKPPAYNAALQYIDIKNYSILTLEIF